jgi:anti-sigma factor RsiW
MTCREVTDALNDYLSGELSPERHAELEGHLAPCADCTNYVAAYKKAVMLLKGSLDSDEPTSTDIPDELVKAIIAARRPN